MASATAAGQGRIDPPDKIDPSVLRGGLILIVALAGPVTNSWLLALWLVIRGVGLGAVTIPVMAVAFLGLDKQQIAHSSVLTRTLQQLGGSFGTAVLAVILTSAITAHQGDLASGFDDAFWWSAKTGHRPSMMTTLHARKYPPAR